MSAFDLISSTREGIGSIHLYDFDRPSFTRVGDCLYPIPGAPDMADVVVDHVPTRHWTQIHRTVRLPAIDAVGRPRAAVIAAARRHLDHA